MTVWTEKFSVNCVKLGYSTFCMKFVFLRFFCSFGSFENSVKLLSPRGVKISAHIKRNKNYNFLVEQI